jgi:hypothetical protein
MAIPVCCLQTQLRNRLIFSGFLDTSPPERSPWLAGRNPLFGAAWSASGWGIGSKSDSVPASDYMNTRIKQCHKKERALRTQNTINNTRDFGVSKLLKNLPALRQIGFQANPCLLDVQKISHDCLIGEDAFDGVVRPAEITGQRASPRFGLWQNVQGPTGSQGQRCWMMNPLLSVSLSGRQVPFPSSRSQST